MELRPLTKAKVTQPKWPMRWSISSHAMRACGQSAPTPSRKQTPLPAFWKSAASRKSARQPIRKTIFRFGAGNARQDRHLHLEPFAEIKLPADWIVDQKIFGPFALDPAFENQIGAVNDGQGLADVVVGN